MSLIEPNVAAYRAAIGACEKAQHRQQALYMFEEMLRKLGRRAPRQAESTRGLRLAFDRARGHHVPQRVRPRPSEATTSAKP